MKQREAIDQSLEMFIHRLVFNKIVTYDQAFSCLQTHECAELRQAKLNFDKGAPKDDKK